MKTCKKCPELGPQSDDLFSPRGRICFNCQLTQQRVRAQAYYEKHKAEKNASDRQYHANHRDENNAKRRLWYQTNLEHSKKGNRLRYEKHREERKAKQRIYTKTHRFELKISSQRYRKTHHSLILAANGRRRAQQSNAPNIESVNRQDIYKRDGGKCHLCHRKVSKKRFHVDHLIPLSKGGSHTALNLAIAHPLCNLRRSDGRIPAQLLLAI